MKRAEFEQHVGSENICPNVSAALARAEEMFKQMPVAIRTVNLQRRRTDITADATAADPT